MMDVYEYCSCRDVNAYGENEVFNSLFFDSTESSRKDSPLDSNSVDPNDKWLNSTQSDSKANEPLLPASPVLQTDDGAVNRNMNSPPVTRSTTGLAFDTDRISNDWFRDRLLRNRASAERSRQRRKHALKGMEDMTSQLEGECVGLREENRDLKRQLEVLQVQLNFPLAV
jgi:hypothetical protein